uniref:Uncharacterized protein n=1 Tax=Panthera leo TaxID=9689 RepID=A0A8C8Y4S6_PANLE
MALLPNALSCHFRIPIQHTRSPDRSGKISFVPSLFCSPRSHPFYKPKPQPKSQSLVSLSLSLIVSLSPSLSSEELPFPL